MIQRFLPLYEVNIKIELIRELKLSDLYEIIKSMNAVQCTTYKDKIYCMHIVYITFRVLISEKEIEIIYLIDTLKEPYYIESNIERIKFACNVIQTLRKLGLIKKLKTIIKYEGKTVIRTIQYCK